MWRLFLTVTLLCWGSGGAVTCKNENGADVHWYILYKAPRRNPQKLTGPKAPKLDSQKLTGLEYVYIDSAGARKMPSNINDPNGVLANTLRPLFTPITSMPNTFGFISYSDQPPEGSASSSSGHSKGVLMMDNSNDGTGVWLLHSTPKFPSVRDQNNFWPKTGAAKAQTFICVTFPNGEFSKIGLHLQEIGAHPFESHIPDTFHQNLKDAVNKVRPNQILKDFRELTSTDPNQVFRSIAKQQSDQTKVGDLYVTIAEGLGTDLEVQTWGCQYGREGSYCVDNFHKILNVESVSTQVGNWKRTNDHSKWCVARDQNKHWTCIADVNRAETQYKRGGGALCLENEGVHRIFKQFLRDIEECPDKNIKKTSDQNKMDIDDCDSDSDVDMDSSLMD